MIFTMILIEAEKNILKTKKIFKPTTKTGEVY